MAKSERTSLQGAAQDSGVASVALQCTPEPSRSRLKCQQRNTFTSESEGKQAKGENKLSFSESLI